MTFQPSAVRRFAVLAVAIGMMGVAAAARALDAHRISEITQIDTRPMLYFTHFWAAGPAAELARGFKAVLDAQRATR